MGRKEEIFLERIGMTGEETPDAFFLGEVEPASVDGIFQEIMDEYVEHIRENIKKATTSEIKARLKEYLCDSYQNYIDILNERYTMKEKEELEDNNYFLHTQKVQRNINFTPDENGYYNYIRHFFSKLPVVKFFTSSQSVYLLEKERIRHTLITGGSGSGKSELMKHIINEYLKKDFNNCLVIIDPHGDLAQEIVSLKNIDKRHLLYFDPSISTKVYPCLNPFQLEDYSEENIETTTQQLINVFEETLNNSQISLPMATILKHCIPVLLQKGGCSLYDLMVFMDDSRNQHFVEFALNTPNRITRDFFKHNFYDRQYNETKHSIFTKLQNLISSTTFYNITCNDSTVSLEKELNRKNILIFNLAVGKIGIETSQTFGRFLVALIQATAMRRANQEKSKRNPVHLFIDEFPNYITKSIETIFTQARKYNIFLTVIMQYLGQNSNTKFQRMILSNTNIKMTGKNEAYTLSTIVKETGASIDSLKNLKPGQFAVKVGGGQSFITKIPKTTLGNKQAVSKEILINRIKSSMYEYYNLPEEHQEQEDQGENESRERQTAGSTRTRKEPLKPKSDY